LNLNRQNQKKNTLIEHHKTGKNEILDEYKVLKSRRKSGVKREEALTYKEIKLMKNRLHLKDWDVLNKNSQLIIHPDVFMDITQERLLQILQDNPNHQITFFKEIIRQNQHKDKGTVDLIRNSQLTIPFEGIPDVFSDIREVEQQIQQDVANYTAYSNVNVWLDLLFFHCPNNTIYLI
ncbi:hypothetical protein MAR_035999, partial [Mya arenaria]